MKKTGLTVIGTAAYGGRNYSLIYEKDQELIWLDCTNSMNSNWDQYMEWASGLNTPGVVTCNTSPDFRATWKGDWRPGRQPTFQRQTTCRSI